MAAVFILSIFIIQELAPNKYDWTPTFDPADKGPYGLYVLRNTIEKVVPGLKVVQTDSSLYEVLADSNLTGTYFYAGDYYTIDEPSVDKLLGWVAKGNTAYIAAPITLDYLADSLKYEKDEEINYNILKDSVKNTIRFVNPSLYHKNEYTVKGTQMMSFFSKYDTSNTRIICVADGEKPDFIVISVGKGKIYLCLLNYCFTNYYYLQEEYTPIVDRLLSYIPEGTLIWDNSDNAYKRESQSSLRYILSQRSLYWVYVLVIAGIALFILFSAKRRQRPIPVIEKPRNTTLEFVRTLSELYYYRPSHKNMAEKKILYFMEYLRRHYNFNTGNIDAGFISKLSGLTQMGETKLTATFGFIAVIGEMESITKKQLIDLNNQVDTIYKRIKNV